MSNSEIGVLAPTMTGIAPCIGAAGADAERIFRDAGLGLEEFENPTLWVVQARYRRVLARASEATGDDCFGLRVAAGFDLRNHGILGYAVLNSATL